MSLGIASASYIPAVQEALSRLLGAAAPQGAGARENRRQCLKVPLYACELFQDIPSFPCCFLSNVIVLAQHSLSRYCDCGLRGKSYQNLFFVAILMKLVLQMMMLLLVGTPLEGLLELSVL